MNYAGIILISISVICLATVLLCLIDRYATRVYNKMSFMESMNLTELPVVTFYQGKRKFNFLLDTGSNYSHITPKSAKLLKGQLSNCPISTSGVGDKSFGSQKVIEATLAYKNNDYHMELIIGDHMTHTFNSIKESSGVRIDGILGNSFLLKYNYVLDFDELIAYQKK